MSYYTGLLESVSNLAVNHFNSTTVLISWSPPFTLEGVPILGYNVTITYTTSGKNETMLVEDTTLLYSIDHPDPENNFTVTVVPINEVGAGQPATLVFFLCKYEYFHNHMYKTYLLPVSQCEYTVQWLFIKIFTTMLYMYIHIS